MPTAAYLFDQAWKHHQTGAFSKAEPLYRQVLELEPANADAWCFLGAACQSQGKLAEAETNHRRALQYLPDHPSAGKCLGIVIAQQGRQEEAAEIFEHLLRQDVTDPELFNNLGLVRSQQGRWDEALVHYEKALALRQDYAETHWNKALALLTLGKLEEGWREYEWRWTQANFTRRNFPQPMWDGSPLNGRTILLYHEQGLGDMIQFIRYAPLVKQRGGTVIVEVHPPLMKLFAGLPGIDRLVPAGSPLPLFHVQTPLLSVPYILGTTLDNVPAEVPYLRADSTLVAHWRQQLEPIKGFKVGITWQGNPDCPGDRQRSVPLTHFVALAQVEGVQLISLQKGAGLKQLQALAGRFPVHDFGSRLDETSGAFMDTAAVMMNLDLVISSDTSVPHLAGALGVPVWMALTLLPNCRWLLERTDCPWYPTMRLFRQKRLGDWDDVFNRIATELEKQCGTAFPGRP